jgi:hypothetical protein
MPRYDFKTLKEKAAQGKNTKYRTLEPEVGVRYKLWIPSEDFLYKRVHYELKTRTPFKHAKFDTLDCMNQEYGEKGSGCPICACIEPMWDTWKEAKTDKEKKQIQGLINQICAEYFYFNAINLSDPDKKFILVKFTKAKMTELLTKVDDRNKEEDKPREYTVSDIIWRYKKSEKGEGKMKKTEYELIDDLAVEETEKLRKQLKAFEAREYDDGGRIDLDQMDTRRARTEKEFLEILGEFSGSSGSGSTGSSSDSEKDLSDVEEESEQLNIDDIADDTDKDKAGKKKDAVVASKTKTAKEEVLETEELSLGDLEEKQDEPLELTDDEPKMIQVTSAIFQEKYKAKETDYCVSVYRYLLDQKLVKSVTGFKEMAQAAFTYIKSKTSIDVPEKAFEGDDVAV